MAKKESTKSFILRLDAATMAAVEKWAADEFRSTNGQLQWIVTEALRKNRRLPKKRAATAEPGPAQSATTDHNPNTIDNEQS